jgi:hypothetical protein
MNVNRVICRVMDGEQVIDAERVAAEHEAILAGLDRAHSRYRTCTGREVRWTYDGKGGMGTFMPEWRQRYISCQTCHKPVGSSYEAKTGQCVTCLAAEHTALGYDDLLT